MLGRKNVKVGQMSGWANVETEKCWVGKMLGGTNVGSDKCRVGQMSVGLVLRSEKYWVQKMLGRKNVGSDIYGRTKLVLPFKHVCSINLKLSI
jgi:hypothetical protein